MNPNEEYSTFVIGLNECFMFCGLQEIELIKGVSQPIQTNPNNVLETQYSMGFNDYEIGQGFKNLKKFTKTT